MNYQAIALGGLLALGSVCAQPTEAQAAGTLKDSKSGDYASIVDHHVGVVLNNGFAKTTVTQVFENATESTIDAIYEFPVPQEAALSEMTIAVGDRVMNGEVLLTDEAEKIYKDQKSQGNQAGLATKDGHQNFRFSVSNIDPGSRATMSFVYYEPLAIDDSVGRYLYPLENGGTAPSFWTGNENVGSFRFDLELKSSLPIDQVRMPGLSPEVTKLDDDHYKVSVEATPSDLTEDVVFYYRFPDSLAGRTEVIPYRSDKGGPGTFLLLHTPGLDLKPVPDGADYVFVLDISGSMSGKIATLRNAVVQSLQKLKPSDRFRVVAFDDRTIDVSGGWLKASAGNVGKAVSAVEQLAVGGSTDLYQGLKTGLSGIDTDRVVSTILVTDAETNTGVLAGHEFDALVRESDVRVYGMLMGNNANWPLMEIIGEASGGFYQQVSNEDDIFGQVQLAFNKAEHEALHDVKLTFDGAGIYDTTDFRLSKVYRGQQLRLFGRYTTPGTAKLALNVKHSGQPKRYDVNVALPTADVDNAELERLWALDMIHAVTKQELLGLIDHAEARRRIERLGLDYQLVTDYTSMIVVDDKTFDELGVDRNNAGRVEQENASGSSGGGYSRGGHDSRYGGATDPVLLALLIALLGGLSLSFWVDRRDRRSRA